MALHFNPPNAEKKTMVWILATLATFIAPLPAHAQGTSVFSQLQDTSRILAQKQFQDCVKNEKNCQLPADVLTALSAPPIGDPSQGATCAAPTPTPTPSSQTDDDDSVQTEVLLVAKIGTLPSRKPSTDQSYPVLDSVSVQMLLQNRADYLAQVQPPFNTDAYWIQSVIDMNAIDENGNPDPNLEKTYRTLLQTELAVQKADQLIEKNPSINENELAQSLSDSIAAVAKTDDEKIAMLTALSGRLYQVYNASRNPMKNGDGGSNAAGNLSLADEIQAAHDWDSSRGGVCNDISQAVATVAAKVFPDQDALVINNGSHFVVLLNDKNNRHTVIDYSSVHQGAGDLVIPGSAASNTRISKVVNGKLKEIAVTDTEVGAVFNQLFDTPRPTLQTGADPNVIFGTLKTEYENRNRHAIETGVKIGTAQTSDSKMIVFVGERRSSSKHGESDTGYGVAFQQQGKDQNAIFALHSGLQRNLIQYVSPRVTLKVSTGIEGEGEVAKSVKDKGMNGFSINAQLIQKASVETHPKNQNRPQFSGDAQLIHSLGVGNWGAHEGVLQNPGASSVLKSFKYMNLHLNQVFAEGTLNVPLTRTLASQTHAQYQGSNVGQKIDLTSGVEIKSMGGMKIFAFVGYAANLKGYQTQHSVLYDPAGLKTGAQVQTKKGIQISTEVQGLGRGQKPIGNLNVAIPILKKSSPKK